MAWNKYRSFTQHKCVNVVFIFTIYQSNGIEKLRKIGMVNHGRMYSDMKSLH